MGTLYGFLLLALLLVFQGIGAYFMRNAAFKKGYGDADHIWAICFWLGIAGYLYVVALPDKTAQQQREDILNVLLQLRQENK